MSSIGRLFKVKELTNGALDGWRGRAVVHQKLSLKFRKNGMPNAPRASKKVVNTAIKVFAKLQQGFIIRLAFSRLIVAVSLTGNSEVIGYFLLSEMKFFADGSKILHWMTPF